MSKSRRRRHARRRTHDVRSMDEALRQAARVFAVHPITVRQIARLRARSDWPGAQSYLRAHAAHCLAAGIAPVLGSLTLALGKPLGATF